MRILFLGPPCPAVTSILTDCGHSLTCVEEPITLDFLEEGAFQFGISYRYRHIVSSPCIDYFKNNIINMHLSYLPWNRGSDPNLWSWLDDTPRGVTIHRMDAGLDTGDILVQEEVPIDIQSATLKSSYMEMSRSLEALFIRHADDILAGRLRPVPQSGYGTCHKSADKAPFLPLLEKQWWDTPVRSLLPEARAVEVQRELERERERERERELTCGNHG